MIAVKVVFFVVVAIALWIIAKEKGFNPWLWFFTAGILGLIVLLCLPSAAAKGIDDNTIQKRRTTANTVGGILTAVTVVAVVVIICL
jgi:phosphatidylglycerophosphate synthase